jgi:inner membrane protein
VNADDSAVSPGENAAESAVSAASRYAGGGQSAGAATVDLVQPVDLYSQVNRATKYGFLFIGFTFAAFLMFDVIGGVRVSTVEYLLVGVGLILFFAIAYLLASAAIIGLITAYSAAVLKSWRRAGYIAGLLIGLYAVLYILLSLEAYSLLIGSLMLFAALAAVMYVTRNLDWGARRGDAEMGVAEA